MIKIAGEEDRGSRRRWNILSGRAGPDDESFGSYIAAWLAPRNPTRHGLVWFVLSLSGAIVAILMDLGPDWYPIGLVVSALPCAWLGGVLYRNAVAGR